MEWRRVAKQGQVWKKKEHAGKLCHIYIYVVKWREARKKRTRPNGYG